MIGDTQKLVSTLRSALAQRLPHTSFVLYVGNGWAMLETSADDVAWRVHPPFRLASRCSSQPCNKNPLPRRTTRRSKQRLIPT